MIIKIYCISMEGAGEGEQRVLWSLLHQKSWGGRRPKSCGDGCVEAKNGEDAFGFQHQVIIKLKTNDAAVFHVLQ